MWLMMGAHGMAGAVIFCAGKFKEKSRRVIGFCGGDPCEQSRGASCLGSKHCEMDLCPTMPQMQGPQAPSP